MISSSSLSSPDIIYWLKVLISVNSARICSVISWASCLEFAIESFFSWISLWVLRTFSSSSISSFSKRLSRLVLSEISALASRVTFFWLSSLHFWAMSAFKGIWEWRSSILCRAAFTSARKKGRWPAGQSLTRSDSGSWDSICSRISSCWNHQPEQWLEQIIDPWWVEADVPN